jgi:hypothetical protein
MADVVTFVIVLFWAAATPAGQTTTSMSISFDSYEACAAVLPGVRASLPADLRESFAGAACVELDLGGRLTQAMPG